MGLPDSMWPSTKRHAEAKQTPVATLLFWRGYNNSGVYVIAVSTAFDSLMAIKKLVFDDGIMTRSFLRDRLWSS
jgi:hypothetical protein